LPSRTVIVETRLLADDRAFASGKPEVSCAWPPLTALLAAVAAALVADAEAGGAESFDSEGSVPASVVNDVRDDLVEAVVVCLIADGAGVGVGGVVLSGRARYLIAGEAADGGDFTSISFDGWEPPDCSAPSSIART